MKPGKHVRYDLEFHDDETLNTVRAEVEFTARFVVDAVVHNSVWTAVGAICAAIDDALMAQGKD